ncbi:MAG: SOS response-associated peptidase [Myxococcota bacterium]|nr:SOS response-associated peptidase [Myxococcota bacterium]MDW8361854.1 SOS response-associated peptidase [Myxococcales bacterium]
MCGRYTIAIDARRIAAELGLESVPVMRPRWNVAPTQDAPVVLDASPRELSLLRWGLLPPWAREPTEGFINARAETVAEKPAFRTALRRHRCLVLADGFYEWRRDGPRKRPHHIRRPDGGLMTFAGLWSTWQPPGGGPPLRTFAIVTTEASATVRAIHERMPLVLERDERAAWLDRSASLEQLRTMLVPHAPALEAVEVGTRVNSPAFDDPACVQPLVRE